MTVFMTKVWGFSAPVGPLVFASMGWRENALKQLKDGDWVILVGTSNDKTALADKNKILGMMEVTRDTVSSLDYNLPRGPQDLKNGEYRWPFGLTIRRAWEFTEPRTRLDQISDRSFHNLSAMTVVPLTVEETAKVLKLPRIECGVLESIRAIARTEGYDEARRRGAPPPTTKRTGIMHFRRAPAFTYAMEITGPNVERAFKIGWSFDYKVRARQFNLYSLPGLGGLRYTPILHEFWPKAFDAYLMERTILEALDAYSFRANREVLSSLTRDELDRVWQASMMLVRNRFDHIEIEAEMEIQPPR